MLAGVRAVARYLTGNGPLAVDRQQAFRMSAESQKPKVRRELANPLRS